MIRFENPPEARRDRPKNGKHQLAADALRARPGAWALIATYPTASVARSIASSITHARFAAYQPARSFEGTSRTVDGEHRVYARYLGEEGTNPR